MNLDDVLKNNLSEVYIKAKNLIPYPFSEATKTSDGITYTVQDNGSIKINGTATAVSHFYIANSITLKKGKTYTLSTNSGLPVILQDKSYTQSVTSINKASTFTAQYTEYTIYISISLNQTVNNITVCPQLELGDVATEFHKSGLLEVDKIVYSSNGTLTTKWTKENA